MQVAAVKFQVILESILASFNEVAMKMLLWLYDARWLAAGLQSDG